MFIFNGLLSELLEKKQYKDIKSDLEKKSKLFL